MIEIPLTQGQVALVDDIDADLAEYKWTACYSVDINSYYAYRKIGLKSVMMHRVILSRMVGRELTRKDMTDHIHHKTLDNRRSELRLATCSQNSGNLRRYKNNKTGYKGVSLHKRENKYSSSIFVEGKRYYLGFYETALEAAIVYDKKAVELRGEFAKTNFPIDNYL